MSIRTEMGPTPKARIAARMREIIVETYERERHSSNLHFPNVPDIADLAEAIDLDLQREILRAQIDAATEFRAFAFVEQKLREFNRLSFEIAKRDHPK
jgi:hypothetical protein